MNIRSSNSGSALSTVSLNQANFRHKRALPMPGPYGNNSGIKTVAGIQAATAPAVYSIYCFDVDIRCTAIAI